MNFSDEKLNQGPLNSINKIKFFDLLICDYNCEDFRAKIRETIINKQKLVINYANANTIRLSKKNDDFKMALEKADIIHSDGIGLWLGAKFLKEPGLKYRFNFTDCASKILEDCHICGWTLFLLGSTDIMLAEAESKLTRDLPNLKIVGFHNGYGDLNSEGLIKSINNKAPDILWIGMGSPKQEVWLHKNVDKLNCKIIQTVGDLITHLAGTKVRGPRLIQKFGLGWLIRLLRHPLKYFDRYIIGIPAFFFLLVKEYIAKHNK